MDLPTPKAKLFQTQCVKWQPYLTSAHNLLLASNHFLKPFFMPNFNLLPGLGSRLTWLVI